LLRWVLCVGSSLSRACAVGLPGFILLLLFIDVARLCSKVVD